MWVHTQSGKAAAKTFDLLLIWFLGIQSEGKSNAVIALYKNIYIYVCAVNSSQAKVCFYVH